MRLAALSVDLDEIGCYSAIHGLAPPSGATANAIYERALPRHASLFDDLGVHATFFVVGRDVERVANAQAVASLARRGHEIASHSYSHRYDLTRLPVDEIRSDVSRSLHVLADVAGRRPIGFRAPGYTITDGVLRVLEELGVAYDSSVFPCPTYYAAKAASIAAIRARGRESRSIVDDPRVLSAPANPYRVGARFFERGAGLVELPIGVTTGRTGRLPFIGTSVVLAGERGARWLARAVVGRPLVNLELHGIDLSDARSDGLSALAAHQPDLRRPFAEKKRALEAVVDELRSAGYSFVTLAEACARVAI